MTVLLVKTVTCLKQDMLIYYSLPLFAATAKLSKTHKRARVKDMDLWHSWIKRYGKLAAVTITTWFWGSMTLLSFFVVCCRNIVSQLLSIHISLLFLRDGTFWCILTEYKVNMPVSWLKLNQLLTHFRQSMSWHSEGWDFFGGTIMTWWLYQKKTNYRNRIDILMTKLMINLFICVRTLKMPINLGMVVCLCKVCSNSGSQFILGVIVPCSLLSLLQTGVTFVGTLR